MSLPRILAVGFPSSKRPARARIRHALVSCSHFVDDALGDAVLIIGINGTVGCKNSIILLRMLLNINKGRVCECQRIFEPSGNQCEMPSSAAALRWLVTPPNCSRRISLYTSTLVTTFLRLLQWSVYIIEALSGGSSIRSLFCLSGSSTVYHSHRVSIAETRPLSGVHEYWR